MQRRQRIIGIAIMAMLGLSACGGGDPRLMNITSNNRGPDEFAILPTRPLQLPPDLDTLPAPTPGGGNLVDPRPQADAVRALGGNPAATVAGGIPATDSALVAHGARNGVEPSIRGQLAAADLEFRSGQQGRPLERLFNVNVYHRVYGPMALDQYAELQRWRSVGARTPAAPPPVD